MDDLGARRDVRHRCQHIRTSTCTCASAMHELSIAMALVDLACEASDRLRVTKIDALHVSIGPLCGVVEDALAFSFELAAAGTPVEGARLVVQQAPLRAFCVSCNEERTIPS